MGSKVCAAKYKMESLFAKYNEAKLAYQEAHKANQEGWEVLKTLKG